MWRSVLTNQVSTKRGVVHHGTGHPLGTEGINDLDAPPTFVGEFVVHKGMDITFLVQETFLAEGLQDAGSIIVRHPPGLQLLKHLLGGAFRLTAIYGRCSIRRAT